MPALLASLALALISALLCFNSRPGLNWLLFVIPATVALYSFTRRVRPETARTLLPPLALAILLTSAAAITASDTNDVLILFTSVFLLTTASRVAAGALVSHAGVAFIAAAPPLAAFDATRESWRHLSDSAQGDGARRSLPVLRGLILALPVVILLWFLLANADPHLQSWGAAIRHAIESLEFVPRLIFGVISFVLVLGTLRLAERETPPNAERPAAVPVITLGATERTIVLGAVTALFALFVALQVTAYFGDPAGMAGSGVTYAEWARRGFGELAAAAALVTLLVVLLDAVAERGAESVEQRVRLTAVLLVALTVLITISALRRVVLYEAAYGYTTARIEAQLFMVGVGIALALLALELRASLDGRRFARRTAFAAATLVTVFVHWNHEAFIVRRNVQQFAGTEKLDVRYLTLRLSPDAIPALIAARDSLSPKESTLLNGCLARLTADQRTRRLSIGRWFESNTRRTAALAALERARPLGDPNACGYTSD